MTQRALIPIVAAARSALKGLVDHSFEGVAYGEASLKEFSKQNLRAGALHVTSYSPNGVSNPGFADLIVSNGSIDVQYVVNSQPYGNIVSPEGQTFPVFTFPKVDEGDSADVVFKYLETYARTNNVALFAPGTQLSFLTIYQSGSVKVNTGVGTIDAPTSGFHLNRIYIPNGDSDSENAKAINDLWKVHTGHTGDSRHASIINNNGDVIEFQCAGTEGAAVGQIEITCKPKVTWPDKNCGLALILSRYVNGVW